MQNQFVYFFCITEFVLLLDEKDLNVFFSTTAPLIFVGTVCSKPTAAVAK